MLCKRSPTFQLVFTSMVRESSVKHQSSLTSHLRNRILPMSYSFMLMLLAVYKAAEYWKISGDFKGIPLVKVVIQDQVMYFFM